MVPGRGDEAVTSAADQAVRYSAESTSEGTDVPPEKPADRERGGNGRPSQIRTGISRADVCSAYWVTSRTGVGYGFIDAAGGSRAAA